MSHSKSQDQEKVYVVFEGRKPGIYLSLTECHEQVNDFKGNRSKSYSSYKEAESKWLQHCNGRAIGDGNPIPQVPHEENVSFANTLVQGEGSIAPRNLAVNTSSQAFVIQQCMQSLLMQVCTKLDIPPPSYKLQEVRNVGEVQYRRYFGTVLLTGEIGSDIVCLGKFATNDYNAQEDVAVSLIGRLLAATGKKIRDFNYYNMKILEEKLQKAKDEKFELEMKKALLIAQIHHLKTNIRKEKEKE